MKHTVVIPIDGGAPRSDKGTTIPNAASTARSCVVLFFFELQQNKSKQQTVSKKEHAMWTKQLKKQQNAYGIVLVRQWRQTPDSNQHTSFVVDDELTQGAFEPL